MDLNTLINNPKFSKLIASLALIAIALVLRVYASRMLSRYVQQSEFRRRWFVNVRNGVFFLLMVGLGAVWVEELQSVGVAILGLGVAFVLATKEFILCLNGSVLRTATNAYSIGDRIEIGGHRGDVIDLNLFTTTLLEVGPVKPFHLRTGRTVIVPNSKLLDSYVINESYMKQFTLHVFSVPLSSDEDWQRAEKVLLAAANEDSSSFLPQAREHMQELEEKYGLEGLPVEPRISIQIPEAGKMNLLVRVPAPVGRQGRLEQAILRRFLTEFRDERLTASDRDAQGFTDSP